MIRTGWIVGCDVTKRWISESDPLYNSSKMADILNTFNSIEL